MLLGHSKVRCLESFHLEKRTKISIGVAYPTSFSTSKCIFKQSCLHLCSKHQLTGQTATQADLDSAELAQEAKFI